jgi:hypothetical protein
MPFSRAIGPSSALTPTDVNDRNVRGARNERHVASRSVHIGEGRFVCPWRSGLALRESAGPPKTDWFV